MDSRTRRSLATLFYIAVTGIATGFLIGLSLSPVISGILTSVLALVLSAVGALAGLKEQEPGEEVSDKERGKMPFTLPSLDVRPIAVMTLALTCGACAGLLARTNDVFGPRPGFYFDRWQGAGLDDKELRLRILNTVGNLGTPSESLQRRDDPHPTFTPIPTPTPHPEPPHHRTEPDHSDTAVVVDERRQYRGSLYDSLSPPPPGQCAYARSRTDDLGKQWQQLTKIAASVRKSWEAPVRACGTKECVALELEVLCPDPSGK